MNGLVVAIVCAAIAGPSYAQLDPCFSHADGALCNDQNPCTLNDTCQAGWCKGTVAPNGTDCTDGNLCTAMDRCVSGLCTGQMLPEGSSCDDNNMCTTGEICRSGTCTPRGNLDCNDRNSCTAELCIPSQGCVYTELPMCPLDGGAGGMGGSGGTAGMGGSAGMGGAPGGDAAADAADGGDADAALDAAWDAAADATADTSRRPDAADADAAPGSVIYEVEGGAWFCGFGLHAQRGSGLPLLVAAAWLARHLRRAFQRKANQNRERN